MPDEAPPKLYRTGQIAAYFGVSRQSIRNWEADGKIPAAHRTVTNHRRFTDKHIKALKTLFGLDKS